MNKLLPLAAALIATAGLTACGSSEAATEPAVVIDVANMSYTPASVTIEKGQTVQWRFDDNGLPPHDVAGDGPLDGVLQSELLTEAPTNSPSTRPARSRTTALHTRRWSAP